MKTLMIVEDDPVIVQVYRDALQRRGFAVEVAEDGLVAMRNLLQLRPDLVVLDVMMPKVDGVYVLKFIRSRPELKHTRVVVLSNATIADVGSPVLAQNPDGVFLKSQCTPSLLAAKINELLGIAEPPAPTEPPAPQAPQ
ncbi:MAG: response regulator [Verrucomicrobiota bacterium]|jgi:CheY-like chemotaxis protein